MVAAWLHSDRMRVEHLIDKTTRKKRRDKEQRKEKESRTKK